MKAQGTSLKDARIVFYGAGSSAVGVATMIAQLLVKEAGLTFEEAKKVPHTLLSVSSSLCAFAASTVYLPSHSCRTACSTRVSSSS